MVGGKRKLKMKWWGRKKRLRGFGGAIMRRLWMTCLCWRFRRTWRERGREENVG